MTNLPTRYLNTGDCVSISEFLKCMTFVEGLYSIRTYLVTSDDMEDNNEKPLINEYNICTQSW